MKFLANATSGVYMSKAPRVSCTIQCVSCLPVYESSVNQCIDMYSKMNVVQYIIIILIFLRFNR